MTEPTQQEKLPAWLLILCAFLFIVFVVCTVAIWDSGM